MLYPRDTGQCWQQCQVFPLQDEGSTAEEWASFRRWYETREQFLQSSAWLLVLMGWPLMYAHHSSAVSLVWTTARAGWVLLLWETF